MKLREFTIDDATIVAKLVGEKSVSEWTSNIPHPYSVKDAMEWITYTRKANDRYPYAIEVDGIIVGCVSHWINSDKKIEVGYWVGRNYWGNGICTKALSMTLASAAFPRVNQVVAKIMEGNIASEHVLLNNGFVYEKNCIINKQGQNVSGRYFTKRIAT